MKRSKRQKTKARRHSRPTTAAVAKLRQKHCLPLPGPMYSRPIQIVRGRGAYLFDEKGTRYIDGFAGVATVSIGHAHPHFVEMISRQLATLGHTTALYLHPSMGDYAKRLVDKAKAVNPEMEMCFFTNSGSEANDMAAMIAKNYTGSHEFISLRHAYHGRTLMGMALTAQHAWRSAQHYVTGVHHAAANYTYRRPDGVSPRQFARMCVSDLADTIKCSTSGKIAAFYAEPINGVGGVMVPEPEYFPEAYAVVKRHGGLFISDEVQTGMGRTGKYFWGIQHWGVKPDIITMAKGIGNGYPIGAVITTKKIGQAMNGKLHFNTYGGSPVAMAAASAVLDVIEKEKLVQNAGDVGGHLIERLKNIGDRSHWVGDVRGKGLMIGVELVKDKKSKEPAAEAASRFLDLACQRKVLIGKGGMAGNIIRIKPPLCLKMNDADRIADVFEEVLKHL